MSLPRLSAEEAVRKPSEYGAGEAWPRSVRHQKEGRKDATHLVGVTIYKVDIPARTTREDRR